MMELSLKSEWGRELISNDVASHLALTVAGRAIAGLGRMAGTQQARDAGEVFDVLPRAPQRLDKKAYDVVTGAITPTTGEDSAQ